MFDEILNINNGFEKKDANEIYLSLLLFVENNKKKIRFQKHPLGFKYFKLGKISKTEELRLHFWVETNENQDDDLQIHDHSFNFESFVVYGSLKNNKFITKYDNNANGLIYNVRFRNGKSRLTLDSKNQLIELISSQIIKNGEFYCLNRNELHKSENLSESTISLLKIIKPENKVTQVYSPKILKEIPSFDRTFISDIENLILMKQLIKKIKLVKNIANKSIKRP